MVKYARRRGKKNRRRSMQGTERSADELRACFSLIWWLLISSVVRFGPGEPAPSCGAVGPPCTMCTPTSHIICSIIPQLVPTSWVNWRLKGLHFSCYDHLLIWSCEAHWLFPPLPAAGADLQYMIPDRMKPVLPFRPYILPRLVASS